MYAKKIIMCVVMCLLMCISSLAKISLLFTPIPITMQLAVCLIAGAVLGACGGALSMLIYICLGMFGLPVFAGMNSGVGYILGHTGGFIVGFIPCAFLAGKLTRFFYKPYGSRLIQFASIFVSLALSTMLLYFFGALYFSVIMNYSFLKASALAVMPFVWLDLIKIVITTLIIRRVFQIKDLNSCV